MKKDETKSRSTNPEVDPSSPHICLLGNSHSIVYREALSEDPAPFDGVHLDIYSTNLKGWQTVSFRDNRFVAGDRRVAQRWRNQHPHKEAITPEDYDAFVLSGLGIRYDYTLRVLLRLGVFPSAVDDRLISRAAVKAMLVAIFKDSVANFLVTSLREVTDAPIAFIFTPVPGETLLEKSQYEHFERSEVARRIALARELTEEAAIEVLADRVKVILPDEALLAENGLTQRHLLRNGGKVQDGLKPHEPGYDHAHMNRQYGRHMLDRFAPVFDEMIAELSGEGRG